MYRKKQAGQSGGFTIIEVMIVLAIAGLILLIVFMALPALQRNARNAQRKSDIASLIGVLQEYVTNSGQIPASCDSTTPSCFVNTTTYSFFKSPAVIRYTKLASPNNYGAPDSEDTVRIFNYMKCKTNYDWVADGSPVGASGHLADTPGASSKTFVILYYAEINGGMNPVCIDV